jgi:hypothetical protein
MATNWDDYTEITTPADGDTALLHDVSETTVGQKMKRITWANIKATLASVFNPYVAPGTSGNVLTSDGTDWTSAAASAGGVISGPGSFMDNGVITVSVASNNLTVALKTIAGADPSAGDPVKVRIGNVYREITAALSVTKNAATNWCNAGGDELATKEIDYFVYLGYNATDGVTIGFSRIPYANLYSEFSATTTNEKYCAISTITNAAAGDNYVNVGRFAATLSAGAGYTWTGPTFTATNIIQKPIFESRWLVWVPTVSSNTGSYTTIVKVYYYKVISTNLFYSCDLTITTKGTAAGNIIATCPFVALLNMIVSGNDANSGKALTGSVLTDGKMYVVIYDGTTDWADTRRPLYSGFYRIA